MRARSVAFMILCCLVGTVVGSMASFTALNEAYAQGVGAVTDSQDGGGISGDVIGAYKAAPIAFFLVIGLYLVSEFILWMDSKIKSNILSLLRPYLVFLVSVLAGAIFSLVAIGSIDGRAIFGAMTASLMLEIKSRKKRPDEQKDVTS
jgi:hypothetical protein